MMYFDVEVTNLQEMLQVLPVCHDAGLRMLQKDRKHVP